MKVSNISEVLIYVMISILILFFVLVFGKIIKNMLNDYEYFVEDGYNAVVYLSSKKNDIINITPDMVIADDFSPVSFKVLKVYGDELDLFTLASQEKTKLRE
mgnify:CR=1 FL=1